MKSHHRFACQQASGTICGRNENILQSFINIPLKPIMTKRKKIPCNRNTNKHYMLQAFLVLTCATAFIGSLCPTKARGNSVVWCCFVASPACLRISLAVIEETKRAVSSAVWQYSVMMRSITEETCSWGYDREEKEMGSDAKSEEDVYERYEGRSHTVCTSYLICCSEEIRWKHVERDSKEDEWTTR